MSTEIDKTEIKKEVDEWRTHVQLAQEREALALVAQKRGLVEGEEDRRDFRPLQLADLESRIAWNQRGIADMVAHEERHADWVREVQALTATNAAIAEALGEIAKAIASRP